MRSTKEYQRQWAKDHPEKGAEYAKRYRDKNRNKILQKQRDKRTYNTSVSEMASRSKTARACLSRRLSWMRSKSKHSVQVTISDLMVLWENQSGRCAITGYPMRHDFGSLFSVSIDRIDSAVAYVPGNIQLVCQAMNFAKNKYSNEDILQFWNYRNG